MQRIEHGADIAFIFKDCHDHVLLSQHLALRPRDLAGYDLNEVELRGHLEALKLRKNPPSSGISKHEIPDISESASTHSRRTQSTQTSSSILEPYTPHDSVSGYSMTTSPAGSVLDLTEQVSGVKKDMRKDSKTVTFDREPTRYFTADEWTLDDVGSEGLSTTVEDIHRPQAAVSNTLNQVSEEDLTAQSLSTPTAPPRTIEPPVDYRQIQLQHLSQETAKYVHQGFHCKGCQVRTFLPKPVQSTVLRRRCRKIS